MVPLTSGFAFPSPAAKASFLLALVGDAALSHAYVAVAVTMVLATLLGIARQRSFSHALYLAVWSTALANLSFFAWILAASAGLGAMLG